MSKETPADPDGHLTACMNANGLTRVLTIGTADFAHVFSREKIPFGLFISLEKPTRQMIQEAEELGVLETFGTRRIPRLQMLTIKEMLEEKKQFQIPEGYLPVRDRGLGGANQSRQRLTIEQQ